MTSDNKYLIEAINPSLPVITYEKQKAKEQRLNFNNFASMDVKSFDSPIGGITNIASNLYAMLPNFEKGTKEYQEIEKRIKLMRLFQGNAIDKTKGISYSPPPKKWSHRQKYIQIPENATQKEIEEITNTNEQIKFDNSICCSKKAYFFGYVYPQKMVEYKQHKKAYNNKCNSRFGMDVNDLIKIVDKSPEQKKLLKDYHNYSPLFNSKCSMNILAKYVESIDSNFKYKRRKESFDFTCMMSMPISEIDKKIAANVLKLVKKYDRIYNSILSNVFCASRNLDEDDTKELRKSLFDSFYADFETDMLSVVKNYDNCINYLCYVFYVMNYGKQRPLLWYCFGDSIVKNVKNNSNHRYRIVENENGKELFGRKYTFIDEYEQEVV